MKSRLENPDLKWETTTEWNLGLDFGFLKSRITGSVELYQRVISDLLNYKPLNTYQEVKQVMANIGKTQSRGIEVTLNTRNIVTKDFLLGNITDVYQIQRSLERTHSGLGNRTYMRKRQTRYEPSTPAVPNISCR